MHSYIALVKAILATTPSLPNPVYLNAKPEKGKTYHTSEASDMPLTPQRFHHCIRNRLATALALGTVAIRMAIDTPGIPIFFHKRGVGIERIAALRAEEVAGVPLGAAGDYDLALDGGLARFAARGEALVEVEVAVEARGGVCAVAGFEFLHLFWGVPAGEEGDVGAGGAGLDAGDAGGVFGGGLRVEGDAFEFLAALVAAEAFGVEAASAGGDDAARDGQRAGRALGACADGGGCPVGAGGGGEGARGGLVGRDGCCGGERLLGVFPGVRERAGGG